MSKNIFLEINNQSGPRPTYVGNNLRTCAQACVCRHILVYAAKVSEAWKRQVFCNNGWGLEWIPYHLRAIPNPFFDEVICRSFPTTLRGAARVWFSKLPASSITNFEQLSNSFVQNFIGGQHHKRPTSYLLTVKQQEGESLREYVKHFNKAVLEIDKADDKVIMTTFQARLNNLDLVFSLGKAPPISMTDLLYKA